MYIFFVKKMTSLFNVIFVCYFVTMVIFSPIAAMVIKIVVLQTNGIIVVGSYVGSNEFWDDQNLVAYAVIFVFCAVMLYVIFGLIWNGILWILWKCLVFLSKIFCNCLISCFTCTPLLLTEKNKIKYSDVSLYE